MLHASSPGLSGVWTINPLSSCTCPACTVYCVLVYWTGLRWIKVNWILLCCIVLYFTAPYCTTTPLWTTVHHTAQHCTGPDFTWLDCIWLDRTGLRCPAFYIVTNTGRCWAALNCTPPVHTLLPCPSPMWNAWRINFKQPSTELTALIPRQLNSNQEKTNI